MRFTFVDSFAGAGGLGLGLEDAGFTPLASFDNDARCIETQKLNTKGSEKQILQASIDDMLDGELLRKCDLKQGELFLLAGGPPCQGFSIQRIGDDLDERNDLVSKYVQLVKEVRPQYFLMENVPGITGRRGRIILERALSEAAKIGYWIHQKTLNAQDYGVPQRRKRVVVVGERLDKELPSFQFPLPLKSEQRTVRSAIEYLPSPPEDGSDHPDYPLHRRDRLSETNKKRLLALKAGQGRDDLPEELLADCHKISSAIVGHRNVYGRMDWDRVAPTITARFDSFTRGQFGHPEQLRSISLREGALLQTFPADYKFAGTKVEVARQVGNAVPPLLAKELGRQILKSFALKVGQKVIF